MKLTFRNPLTPWCIFLLLLASSCLSTKKAKQFVYLNNLADSGFQKTVDAPDPRIQPGDRLLVTVGALNPESAIPYNPPAAAAAASTATATSLPGYLVSKDGTIHLPQLGKMKAAGLTRQELVDTLTGILTTFVKDPVVTVQVTNFKITILGDVLNPGTKIIPEGKINLLEAIGLSGDLTVFARRDNVLVMREKNGRREFGRVDLTSTNLFTSPYYNLQQNDVIFVEMTKSKIDASDQSLVRNVSVAASVVSLLTTIIIVIVNLK